MLLRDLLKKENNNLDIFRVGAALMVIYGHAYAIVPTPGQIDIIGRWLGFDYSGSLAVKVFFFLSGLVVTNSLMTKRSVTHFVISRVFRIWPALIVVLLACALILGPVFTELPVVAYLSLGQVYGYIEHNALMDVQYVLPGVFENLPRNAVNGSLWSIPYEVAAYIVLLSVFMMRLLEPRYLATLMFLVILADAALGNTLVFTWLPDNSEIITLAPCFAFGALLALWKDEIMINAPLCAGAWGLFFILSTSTYNYYFLYAAMFLTILYVSGLKLVVALKPRVDVSYGTYLWGWPIQQVMAYFFLEYGLRFNQVTSMVIALLFGLASWHLIEKRCIRMGSTISLKLGAGRPSATPPVTKQASKLGAEP